MKIYLAGPMTGYDDLNFPTFYEVARKLRAQGHTVFNPAEVSYGKPPKEVTRREALKPDLMWLLDEAEAIIFLPGWQDSLGAKAEHAVAKAIGLFMKEYED